MADTTYIDNTTIIYAEWLNEVNNLVHKIFGGTSYAAQVVAIDNTTGAVTVSKATTFSSTVAVASDFSINTNKFTVTAASGNTAVAGTLDIVGNVQVNTNKVTIDASTGDVVVAGAVTVGGALSVSGAFTSLGIDDNATGIVFTLSDSLIAMTTDLTVNSTGAVQVSAGTTAQRPTGATGKLRFNTTITALEVYNGSSWDPATGVFLPLAGGTLTGNVGNTSTGYFQVASGTTAERAGTGVGQVRHNTTLDDIEFYTSGGEYKQVGPVSMTTHTFVGTETYIDFTGIPSWVKRITILFSGVVRSSTSNPLIQVGVAGSPVTSGYLGASDRTANGLTTAIAANYTTGFGVDSSAATHILHGNIYINVLDAANYIWTCDGNLSVSNVAAQIRTSGSVTLAGVLDMIRITTVGGTDTFNAGTVNVMYE